MPFLSANTSSSYQEEIPITSTPIFEGHLYIRTVKKQWQWRLFRFDGSNFTCLSSKRVKVLPQSVQNTSSLLLMTPKDKEKRIIKDEKLELKYYQLPEWTIDITNISSISILKRKKHSNSNVSKCFSIRTFDSNQFILKAQKQKDLERWLFVLTKMWKFTQTIQDHLNQYYSTPTPPQLVQQQLEETVDDNTPLAHTMNTKPLSNEKIQVIEEWRKSLAELMANDPTIRITTPPPIEPIPDDDTMSIFTDMTSVSKRPKNSIKRRTSKRSTTTSRSLRRNKSNSVSPSTNNNNNNNKESSLEGRPLLKKKRSDDVRNWMNDKRKLSHIQIEPSSTQNKHCSTSPEIVQYMNFFQDALTICDDEACPYEHYPPQQKNSINNKLKYHTSVRGKKLIQINQGDPSSPNNSDNRRSRVYEEGDDVEEKERGRVSNHSSLEQKKRSMSKEGDDVEADSNLDTYLPATTHITRRASIPLMMNQHISQKEQQQLLQQQYLFDQQKMNFLSPLQFISLTGTSYNNNNNALIQEQQKEEEEEMSLADLQKSLRQISIHHQQYYHPSYPTTNYHTRSTSMNDLQQQHQYVQYPSSIVAPAIPPHQYHRPSSFYLPNDFSYQHQQFLGNNMATSTNPLIPSSCPPTVRRKK